MSKFEGYIYLAAALGFVGILWALMCLIVAVLG